MNILEAVDTKSLLAELMRRDRVRAVSYTATYYNEMAEDDKYMRSIYEDSIRVMMRELDNKLWIKFNDVVIAKDADGRPVRTSRQASLWVIIPKDTKDGG